MSSPSCTSKSGFEPPKSNASGKSRNESGIARRRARKSTERDKQTLEDITAQIQGYRMARDIREYVGLMQKIIADGRVAGHRCWRAG